MTCSSVDLKAYCLGELDRREAALVDDHVRACRPCGEELDRLSLTRAALATLQDEEVPQRIAFVSDRVFEPRWWQTIWRSGPVMGFASAAMLAGAIFVHAFARPAVPFATAPQMDTAQIERQVEAQVNARVNAAIAKAVADSQAKQSAEFAQALKATDARFEARHQSEMAMIQEAADYYHKQIARFEVASNEGPAQ
jgi:anti-sigma factor RsiW